MRTQVPFIDFTAQYKEIETEIREVVQKIFTSQQFILKEYVPRLETEIAKKLDTRFAVGVASGSDALYLTLMALGIGPGDEVITTPFTFFASAGSISRAGAKPVFADIDPQTFNIDPRSIEKWITPRTKAIIPVHLFGLSCEMDAILSIAKKRALHVVEDAAQSFGASYKGRQTGSMGTAGCLSFFPTKNLGGAGDGGMVVTSSEDLADKIRLLRVHGSKTKYYHEVIGMNSRLDELQAAVLLVKLKYIDAWNEKRKRHASFYNEALRGLPLTAPACPAENNHVYHLYSILMDGRDGLSEFLTQRGIGTGICYPLCLHLQPCYKDLGHPKGDYPSAERTSKRILSLPMYPEMTEDARNAVVENIQTYFSERKKS